MSNDTLPDLSDLLGSAARTRIEARWPVSVSAIQSWKDVMRLAFPSLGDPYDAAHVPPPMIYSWTLPGAGEPIDPLPPKEQVRNRLLPLGYTGLIATNLEHHHLRPLSVGDRPVETCWVESVSEPKSTWLGEGHFLNSVHEFSLGTEVVARQRLRVFFFRPSQSRGPLGGRSDESAPEGALLAEIDVTPTLIVAGAMMTNDFEPVHHDHAFARSEGHRDIIMNILTTLGIASTTVAARHGAEWLTRTALHLGAPTYPGDTLRLISHGLQDDSLGISLWHARGLHARFSFTRR